jgi:hypothetical protein
MAARPVRITLQSLPIQRVEDINQAFEHAAREQAQERPSLIERIADRACLAKLKRQRIFNDDANSSRPTCFGARVEGR